MLARGFGRPVVATAATESKQPRTDVALNALVAISSPAQAAVQALALVEAGFGCLKLKGGGDADGRLVDRVAAVRSAVGADIGLRIDLNGTLDVASARQLLGSLVPFDIKYVEQPLSPDSGPEASARLRRAVPIPIVADEAVASPEATRALLDAEAVDVLVVKPARVGGLRCAVRIIETAAEAGVPVVVSTLFETGIGIAAALRLAAALRGPERAHGLATADLLASDLLARQLRIVDGRMTMPPGPGLGIDLDAAAVERFSVT
jgi:L-alanine-DL-glutamate epimerase-like enolase superfamily enzyme